jgi:5'(3')-deoxyribonucleotidase
MVVGQKPVFITDLDEVICKGGFLYLMNTFLGTKYVESDFNTYYMQDKIPEQYKKAFFEYFKSKNFYDYCTLIPYVVESLKEIKESYDVYVASSYIVLEILKESVLLVPHKHNYLMEVLPFIDPKHYIFIDNKHLLRCSVMVDDTARNLGSATERNFLFTSYHNHNLCEDDLKKKGIERVDDWPSIIKRLSIK